MEQILLAYGLPAETVAAIMIPYRNTQVKVRSPDVDTEYFDIVAGVLQGDKLQASPIPLYHLIPPCLTLSIIRYGQGLAYVLRTSIDNIREKRLRADKEKSRRYPAKTITDADYADDIVLLANTPNQAETLLHSLERALQALDSLLMHTKLNLCALIRKATSPH